MTSLIGKVWTSLYGYKRKERPYGYLVSSSIFGNVVPFLRGRDLGFGLAQWVLKEQGPYPVGSGTPCSLLQPRRIHGWAID